MSERLNSRHNDPALEYMDNIEFVIPRQRKLGATAMGAMDPKIKAFQAKHNL